MKTEDLDLLEKRQGQGEDTQASQGDRDEHISKHTAEVSMEPKVPEGGSLAAQAQSDSDNEQLLEEIDRSGQHD